MIALPEHPFPMSDASFSKRNLKDCLKLIRLSEG